MWKPGLPATAFLISFNHVLGPLKDEHCRRGSVASYLNTSLDFDHRYR